MAGTESDAAKKLLDVLEPFSDDARARLLDGVAILMGVAPRRPRSGTGDAGGSGGDGESASDGSVGKAAQYFAEKAPSSKQEELAVAARYRRLAGGAEVHTKEELQEVFNHAGVNFDSHNFARDLDNAKNSGLFLRGAEIKLSYNGTKFVDALPDRDTASKFKAKARAKKKGKKKAKKGTGIRGG